MEDQVPSSNQPHYTPETGAYYEDPEGPRYSNPAEFSAATQAPVIPPQPPGLQMNFQQMREKALQDAIAQVTATSAVSQSAPQPAPQFVSQVQQPVPQPQPKVVYVRRNLTLAELAVVFVISAGVVLGGQSIWAIATDILPRIEIRDK